MDIDTVYMILALILLVVGIALALFGRAIWDAVMSAIGGMIGWMLGFGIGIWYFGSDSWTGIIIAIVMGFIGSFILATIFGFLVEAALSLVAGILIGVFVFYLTDSIIYAAIAMAVIAIVSFIFIERLIAIITAFIGAVLAAAAVWYLYGFDLAVLAFILLFIIGSILQQFVLDDNTTGY